MKLEAAMEMTKARKPITVEAGGQGSGRRPSGGDPGKNTFHQGLHITLANRGFKTNPGFSGKAFQGYSHPQGHDVVTKTDGSWVHGSNDAHGKLTVGNGSDSLAKHLDDHSGIHYSGVVHPRVQNTKLF